MIELAPSSSRQQQTIFYRYPLQLCQAWHLCQVSPSMTNCTIAVIIVIFGAFSIVEKCLSFTLSTLVVLTRVTNSFTLFSLFFPLKNSQFLSVMICGTSQDGNKGKAGSKKNPTSNVKDTVSSSGQQREIISTIVVGLGLFSCSPLYQ